MVIVAVPEGRRLVYDDEARRICDPVFLLSGHVYDRIVRCLQRLVVPKHRIVTIAASEALIVARLPVATEVGRFQPAFLLSVIGGTVEHLRGFEVRIQWPVRGFGDAPKSWGGILAAQREVINFKPRRTGKTNWF